MILGTCLKTLNALVWQTSQQNCIVKCRKANILNKTEVTAEARKSFVLKKSHGELFFKLVFVVNAVHKLQQLGDIDIRH